MHDFESGQKEGDYIMLRRKDGYATNNNLQILCRPFDFWKGTK